MPKSEKRRLAFGIAMLVFGLTVMVVGIVRGFTSRGVVFAAPAGAGAALLVRRILERE